MRTIGVDTGIGNEEILGTVRKILCLDGKRSVGNARGKLQVLYMFETSTQCSVNLGNKFWKFRSYCYLRVVLESLRLLSEYLTVRRCYNEIHQDSTIWSWHEKIIDPKNWGHMKCTAKCFVWFGMFKYVSEWSPYLISLLLANNPCKLLELQLSHPMSTC